MLGKLREFQDAGHTVVLIIGDFTARVGDPSGRSAPAAAALAGGDRGQRRDLPGAGLQGARPASGPRSASTASGCGWTPEELLGLLAQTTVARLLERDDFQKRMAAGAPIAALELLYPLLQGYDSVAVEADVELGGTDQKFNLLFGRDIQAAYGQQPQSILTMPILVGTDGVQKMSKSLGNYVGVTEPPEEMFGKADARPRRGDARVLPAAARRGAARRAARTRPSASWRGGIVDRFHGEGAAAAAEEHFNRLFVDHERARRGRGGWPRSLRRRATAARSTCRS